MAGELKRRPSLVRGMQRQLRSVRDPEFSEDTVKVFFHRTLGEAQFVGDLFVHLRLADQLHHLLFAESKLMPGFPVNDALLGRSAARTNVLSAECGEATPTASAAS